MDDIIGQATHAIISNFEKELKKKKTKQKIIDNILEPIICEFTSKYYKHFLFAMTMGAVMIILLLAIFILSFNQK